METEVKLTKLAGCAGCGAKVGAGTLVHLLEGFRTHTDPHLIVGYDRAMTQACMCSMRTARWCRRPTSSRPSWTIRSCTDRWRAANALSDVYAMGGEPQLCALNIMCLAQSLDDHAVQEILRGGYDKAYEAGAIITGGHTIQGAEPIYGLAVSGFVHPKKVLTNSGAKPGDVLILTKPLGVGVLTTAAKADLVEKSVLDRIYRQMAALNKAARDVMVKYPVHSCTDVTGFSLLGHSFEMAQGSGVSVHLRADDVPYHAEAYPLAEMGLIPAGAYRNRQYAEAGVCVKGKVSRTLQDLFYDPQTSGGLLFALPEQDAQGCLDELQQSVPEAKIVGYVTEKQEFSIYLE